MNHDYHSKMKHIDVQYHFMGDMVESKKAMLKKFETLENVLVLLKKSMNIENLSWCREAMSIFDLDC